MLNSLCKGVFWSLCLFTTGSLLGQVVGSASLPIAGAVVFHGLQLEDDGAMTVGAVNDQLQLVRWTDQGDTVWTKTHPIPPNEFDCGSLIRLSNGDFLVAGKHLFDANGNFVETNDFGSTTIVLAGQDSLLVVYGDSMHLFDRDHSLHWERPFACHMDNVVFGAYMVNQRALRSGNTILAYTAYRDFINGVGGTSRAYYSRYGMDGTLIDTTEVLSVGAAPDVGASIGKDRGDDGAILVGQMGMGPVLFRINHSGALMWWRFHDSWDIWPVETVRGYAPQNSLIRSDHSIVTFGIAYDLATMSAEIGLMLFDDIGMPICWESLGNAQYSSVIWNLIAPLGFVYETSDGRIVAIGTTVDGGFAPIVQWRAFDTLCFSVGAGDTPAMNSDLLGVQLRPGSMDVEMKGSAGSSTVQLVDLRGAVLVEQRSPSAKHHISTIGLASGAYVVMVTDMKCGRRAVGRILLD